MLRYAYNTNGCAHHRLTDALELIAHAGYDGVALTLDWHHLDPFAEDWEQRTRVLARQLRDLRLGCVIETGARYLLTPGQKHEPTLINPDPAGRVRRLDFLKRAIDIGQLLNAETVSFWAGVKQEEVTTDDAIAYLDAGLLQIADYAGRQGADISLEPEPGMLIETNADYEALLARQPDLRRPLKLALDLGHVWVTGETYGTETDALPAPAAAVHRYRDRLGTISIEGMNRGKHLHLPLDQGDMPIPPLVQALQDVDFQRLVCVELSRESPRAHLAIPESIQYLKKMSESLNY